jgi:hypothetical protein
MPAVFWNTSRLSRTSAISRVDIGMLARFSFV